MPLLRIPEPVQTVFRKLASMEDGAVRELNEVIGKNLETLMSPDEAVTVSRTFKTLPAATAFEMLNAIVPYIFGRVSNAIDASAEVGDLMRAVGGKKGDAKWTKAEDKRLKANLTLLLEDPRTRLKAKSMRLLTTHEKQLDECEVLSDIRPVFSADGKLAAEAAVICHTLRISYIDHEARDFFVALNLKDLKAVKRAIDRAIEKDQLLAQLISKIGIEYVCVT